MQNIGRYSLFIFFMVYYTYICRSHCLPKNIENLSPATSPVYFGIHKNMTYKESAAYMTDYFYTYFYNIT